MKGGAVCYLSARVDEPRQVIGDDSPIYPYVVVLWTHDGSGALQARRTSVRPVCWNTISMGEAEARRSGRDFTFRHTKNVLARIEEAKRVIAGAREETAAFVELANELARMPVTDEQRERFVTTYIPRPEAVVISDQVLDNILRERTKVRAIYESPTIPEGHRNTAYGLVQAGIEYLDHLRAYRNSDTYLRRTLLLLIDGREDDVKGLLKPPEHLDLPLDGKRSWAEDQNPFDSLAELELLDEQARHDGLVSTRVIGRLRDALLAQDAKGPEEGDRPVQGCRPAA